MLEAARARALTTLLGTVPTVGERARERETQAAATIRFENTVILVFPPREPVNSIPILSLRAAPRCAVSFHRWAILQADIGRPDHGHTRGSRAHARYRGNARRQRVSVTVVRSVVAVPDPLVRVIAAAAARRCENSRCTIGPRAPTGPPSRLIFAATPHCQTRTTTERPSDD